ncbi:ABC transporter substrate-binding protein [Paenibacillus sp. BIHB 4019]|uniref:ABC transporter substrate-binding protein n=1 Tax=Paenibacillus sp. BIHB 4019 TaxID=1870819 RepID=A0A1B2DGJ8_9BACL|nr:ABC transporter substrate-binding protein [Paenibacillus sp. BIHB 4019]ANY66857.1 ABC transporter substrate-binding protein [Paenibacillus sp. BIHB 4019]
MFGSEKTMGRGRYTLRGFTLLMLMLLAAMISACGNNNGANTAANAAASNSAGLASSAPSAEPTAAAPQTITIKHAYAETEVPIKPKRVAVYGLEDVMLSLEAPMVYANSFKGYYLDDQLQKLGIPLSNNTNFQPNLEAILKSQPDLIIVQQYSVDANSYAELSKIAPTITFAPDDWKKALAEIGQVLGMEDKAQQVLQAHEGKIKQAKETIINAVGADKTVVFMRPSEKDLQVFFPSFNLVYNDLGLNPDASIAMFQKKTSDDWGITTSLEELPSITADYVFAIYGGSLETEEEYNKQEGVALGIEKLSLWQQMPAVKQSHVFKVSARHWMSSGPIAESREVDDVVAAVTGK